MGRRAVVPEQLEAVMSGGDRHCWTLEQLHDDLRTAGHPADPSTVFRALGRLEAQGVVRTVPIDGRRGHYELAGEHHEHLVCEGCRRIEAVPCGLVASWVEQVRATCGFEVAGHQLVLRGWCRRCLDDGRASERPLAAREGR